MQQLRRIRRLPFLLILLAIAGYLWIFGDKYFPGWEAAGYTGTTFSTTVSYYFVLIVVFLILSRFQKQSNLYTPVEEGFKRFMIGFLAVTILFSVSYVLSGAKVSPIRPEFWFPMLIMQICVVAPAEELMFRNSLQYWIGWIWQAPLFALFHSAVYGVVWVAGWPPLPTSTMIALFGAAMFGLVMGYIAKNKKLGLTTCIGAHAAWNLLIFGVLVI
jgi:hypothetical protein